MSKKIELEIFDVEEKLPEYDHDCIVWFDDGIGVYVGQYKEEIKEWVSNNGNILGVKRWAQFPD